MTTKSHQPVSEILVFYSVSGGVGGTTAVANIAFLLAARGHSVLIVDWDLDTADIRLYLQPLMDQSRGQSGGLVALGRQYVDPAQDGAAELDVHPHVIPLTGSTIGYLGLDTAHDLEFASSAPTGWAELTTRSDGGSGFDVAGFARALRQALLSTPYDYVLVDCPVGQSETARAALEGLADGIVTGFLLPVSYVRKAERAVSRAISNVRRAIRVLPVAMKVRPGASLEAARQAFAWALAGLDEDERQAYWDKAQVPLNPDDEDEYRLAVLDDGPGARTELVAAYNGLADLITLREEASRPAEVSAALRAAYRSAVRTPAGAIRVALVHAPRDIAWAEWTTVVLLAHGLHVVPASTTPGAFRYLLVIGSRGLGEVPGIAELGDTSARIIGLKVGEDSDLFSFEPHQEVDLRQGEEPESLQRLLAALGLIPGDHWQGSDETGVRFPRQLPTISNIPPRNLEFIGRNDVLQQARAQLRRGAGARETAFRPYHLTGPPGIGKSHAALEYAHRFASNYDLIWWIPAQTDEDVHSSLTLLAGELELDGGGDRVLAALQALGEDQGSAPQNWLLIYDNAAEPESLSRLQPTGTRTGHVIVTSREPGPGPVITEFTDAETAELVAVSIPEITAADSTRLLAAVGNLPLSAGLAAACVAVDAAHEHHLGTPYHGAIGLAVQDYLDRHAGLPAHDLDLLAEGLPPSALDAVRLSIESLYGKPHGPVALRLLQLVAHLSPDGVSRRLLFSPEFLRPLVAVDPEVEDDLVLEVVFETIVRHRLAEVLHETTGAVRVHALVQLALRSATITPSEADPHDPVKDREWVHDVLAAFTPADGERVRPYAREALSEVQRHLVVSGAPESTARNVRRMIVTQLGYLRDTEDRSSLETGRRLGEDLLSAWRADPAIDEDAYTRRLSVELASICRLLGDYDRAAELTEEALRLQRRKAGLTHPRTLRMTATYADTLRTRGLFEDAYLEDQTALTASKIAFGPDHSVTLSSINNLVLSLILAGEPELALSMELDNQLRRARLLGPTHPRTCRSARRLGTLYRELGDLTESQRWLYKAVEPLERSLQTEVLERMRTGRSLALTLTQLGRDEGDMGLVSDAAKKSGDVLDSFRRFGALNRGALAVTLDRAGQLFLLGQHDQAAGHGRQALADYAQVFGPKHPFTNICRTDLSIYLRATGADEEARELSTEAWQALTDRLGDEHPVAIAATVNHGLALREDDEAAAQEHLQEAADRYRDRFGAAHPNTVRAEQCLQGENRPIQIEQPLD